MNTDHHKISFIICANQTGYLTECSRYIQALAIPDGYSIDIIPITGAHSMAAGYNQGMQQTDARYKVYLHQDVFILNRDFLLKTLEIFQHNEKIGMIGMVGTKRLPDNACMWTTPMRAGSLRSCVLNTVDDYFDLPINPAKGFSPVQAIDGLLMMTQYDIPWREDLDLGWDFYDISQSLEFARYGYRIAVPYQASPWVLHDNGFLHLAGYHMAREKFLTEYFPERKEEIAACGPAARQAAEHRKQLDGASEIIRQVLTLLTHARLAESGTETPGGSSTRHGGDGSSADAVYTQAISLLRSHLEEFQDSEDYCLLCILANIQEAELAQNIETPVFSRIQPDLAWIRAFYQQIKFHIWQQQYLFSADIQYAAKQYLQEHLSNTALQYFTTLATPAL